jgi:hypothetical protein
MRSRAEIWGEIGGEAKYINKRIRWMLNTRKENGLTKREEKIN